MRSDLSSVGFGLTDSKNKARIALIGCGAVAQSHARAIASLQQATCTVLFDVDVGRTEMFRKTFFPGSALAKNLREIPALADAAIVATPNVYHASVTKEMLEAGLHVLCEKPLAITAFDTREMLAAAERTKRVLACGLVRRFYSSTKLVTETLQRNLIGHPLGFEIRESVWNWPISRDAFDRTTSGGGVLIDLGPHVIDLLETWFGPVELVEARDDCRGGVEASSLVRLRCYLANGNALTGTIFLSRAYRAKNIAKIFCTEGQIEVDPHITDSINLIFKEGNAIPVTMSRTDKCDPFAEQLAEFLNDIHFGKTVTASAIAAAGSVGLIESCYQKRNVMPELWTGEATSTAIRRALVIPDYKKILVTGAAGAVGSRLAEMWADDGRLDRLRCMVRSYKTAARLKRFPTEIVEADLLDRQALLKAAEGCDAIIHLGVGERAAKETKTILDTAIRLGIRRFVHVSTAAVYGRLIPANIEELQDESPVVKTGEPYADQKAEAERLAIQACARGLEAVILRPHIVYGPYLRWSAELALMLAEGKIPVLQNGGSQGEGWCNLIYIDDLVEAITLALNAEACFGQPMFITDGQPVRWLDYIASHAELLDVAPDHISRNEILGSERSVREWIRDSVTPLIPVIKSKEFRDFVFESPAIQATLFQAYLGIRNLKMVRPFLDKLRAGKSGGRAVPAKNRYDEMWTMLQLSEARLSADKAERLLRFRARVDYSEGLRRTADWFSLYGLIPKDTAFDAQSYGMEAAT